METDNKQSPIEMLRDKLRVKPPLINDFSDFHEITDLNSAISPLILREERIVHILAKSVRTAKNQILNGDSSDDSLKRLAVDVNEIVDTYKQLCADFGEGAEGYLNPDFIKRIGNDIINESDNVGIDDENSETIAEEQDDFDRLVAKLRANHEYLTMIISESVMEMYDSLSEKLKISNSPLKPTKEGHPDNLESFDRAFEIL